MRVLPILLYVGMNEANLYQAWSDIPASGVLSTIPVVLWICVIILKLEICMV